MTEIICLFDWREQTKSFLLLISLAPTNYGNFRIEAKDCAITFQNGQPTKAVLDMRISWAPSWLELGKIMEVLRFVDFLNSWKLPHKLELKAIIGHSWRTLDNILQQRWFNYKLREGKSLNVPTTTHTS